MNLRTNQIVLALSAALFMAFFAGCSKSPAQAIVGTWVVDMEKTVSLIEDEEERAEAEAELEEQEGFKMELEFGSDGSLTMTMNLTGEGEDRVETGTYEVVSEDAEAGTVTINATQEGEEEPEEMVFTFVDNNTITMPFIGGDSIAFARQ